MQPSRFTLPAPELRDAVYVHVGAGGRFHTARDEHAAATDCGIGFAGRWHTFEHPRMAGAYPTMRLVDVCRRCAARHPALGECLA